LSFLTKQVVGEDTKRKSNIMAKCIDVGNVDKEDNGSLLTCKQNLRVAPFEAKKSRRKAGLDYFSETVLKQLFQITFKSFIKQKRPFYQQRPCVSRGYVLFYRLFDADKII